MENPDPVGTRSESVSHKPAFYVRFLHPVRFAGPPSPGGPQEWLSDEDSHPEQAQRVEGSFSPTARPPTRVCVRAIPKAQHRGASGL